MSFPQKNIYEEDYEPYDLEKDIASTVKGAFKRAKLQIAHEEAARNGAPDPLERFAVDRKMLVAMYAYNEISANDSLVSTVRLRSMREANEKLDALLNNQLLGGANTANYSIVYVESLVRAYMNPDSAYHSDGVKYIDYYQLDRADNYDRIYANKLLLYWNYTDIFDQALIYVMRGMDYKSAARSVEYGVDYDLSRSLIDGA